MALKRQTQTALRENAKVAELAYETYQEYARSNRGESEEKSRLFQHLQETATLATELEKKLSYVTHRAMEMTCAAGRAIYRLRDAAIDVQHFSTPSIEGGIFGTGVLINPPNDYEARFFDLNFSLFYLICSI
jgi:hypothetical protein